MDLTVLEIIKILVALIAGGGGTFLIFYRSQKKKLSASATKEEHLSNQELERSHRMALENTEELITMYKKAVEDLKVIHDREKIMLIEAVKTQDEEITKAKTEKKKLTTEIVDYALRIESLIKEAKELKEELQEFDDFTDENCKECPIFIKFRSSKLEKE